LYNEHFAEVEISATQFWLLCAIEGGAANSLTELADVLGVEKSTLKRNVDRLMASEHITQVQGEGRRVIYRLKPSGRRQLREALPIWRNVQKRLESVLPPGKSDEIRRDLRLLRTQAKTLVSREAEDE
jgi:DNA-binding MarR family transcriptional regulator